MTQAQADHKYKSDIFSIDKVLNVYTDGNRVISATPKVAPTVDELPELDITADIPSDLNTKQNPDGIGATPKDAPHVEELPTQNPDEVEQPKVDEPKNEKPKVEEPGKDPSQEPSKEPGKEPGQSGDQDVKPVESALSYQAPAVLHQAKQEAEQKALPNTGSQVSILALLGYAFLAGLGIVLKKKEG